MLDFVIRIILLKIHWRVSNVSLAKRRLVITFMLLIFRTKANLSEKKVWHVIIDDRRSLIKRQIYNVKECCRHHFSYFHNNLITTFLSVSHRKEIGDINSIFDMQESILYNVRDWFRINVLIVNIRNIWLIFQTWHVLIRQS